MARIAIRTILYPDSPRGHVARSSIRTPLGRSTCHSRMSRPNDNISYPDHWLKWASLATSFRQPATAHYPLPAERNDRVGSRSPPTIHRLQCERTWMMASHLPRSLTAAHRVMMALPPPWSHHDKPKSPPLIKEGGRVSDTIKRNLHTRKKVSLLYLVKGQLPNLLNLSRYMADKTIGGCVRTPFAGTTEPKIYLGWKRASTWQLLGSSGCKASIIERSFSFCSLCSSMMNLIISFLVIF